MGGVLENGDPGTPGACPGHTVEQSDLGGWQRVRAGRWAPAGAGRGVGSWTPGYRGSVGASPSLSCAAPTSWPPGPASTCTPTPVSLPQGASALFDMIEYYESATHLNISFNKHIGTRGWQAAAHMMRKVGVPRLPLG